MVVVTQQTTTPFNCNSTTTFPNCHQSQKVPITISGPGFTLPRKIRDEDLEYQFPSKTPPLSPETPPRYQKHNFSHLAHCLKNPGSTKKQPNQKEEKPSQKKEKWSSCQKEKDCSTSPRFGPSCLANGSCMCPSRRALSPICFWSFTEMMESVLSQ